MKRQHETTNLMERRLTAVADKQTELKERIEKLQSRTRTLVRSFRA